jgi:DNA helicase-2/ATP-dependent DNA helicase PcrA
VTRHGPRRLAELLGLPPPTGEQAAVIGAPLAPLLVVAGAGSGKTETMAARVVFLVANGLVHPDQVLGLTFTRKAAGELAHRIRHRLGQLARVPGLAGDRPRDAVAGEPTVATYHSYAARVVAEHGLRAGYEPTTRLLTEAACWQLADAVVRSYDGDMSDVDLAPVTVTEAVLGLSADLSEHLRGADELVAFTDALAGRITALPGRLPADITRVLGRQRARVQLLPLVAEYNRRKRAVEAMDYGDQLARAARVARDHRAVGATERDRYRVVLLDEYQDTSYAQVVLLRSLFGGGHPVTAVGDPCQSIYAWRGASAGTLNRFPADFRAADGRPAHRLELTISWRNAAPILRVANAISAPVRAVDGAAVVLAPAPGRQATGGPPAVRCALLDTAAAEAAWIADRIAAIWSADTAPAAEPPDGGQIPVPDAVATPARHAPGPGDAPPTSAVLVRSRRQIPVIELALRERGLPVEVVGLGGLLDTPEVRDVVTTLQVLADPTAGAALLRLLTGPRWRLGPRDVVALHRRARELSRRRRHRPPEAGPQPAVSDRLDDVALVEALDDLGPAVAYSPDGYRRLAALAAELAALRGRLDQSLPDLVADVERTIGLDVEVAVRPGEGAAAGLARAHLDTFGDVAARFAADADGATLASFLAFLSAAEEQERGLEPGHVEVVEGAVQLLTAHAAKGLEWDVVALAGASAGVFPATSQPEHWLGKPGVLPFPLRGDEAELPVFAVAGAADAKELAARHKEFVASWRAHDAAEERRLAYVAVTRPRRLLLCSGYWWDDAAKGRRGPSALLAEVRDECLAGAGAVDAWAPDPPPDAVNPVTADPPRAPWPADPLGPRRAPLTAAAALVHAELATLSNEEVPSNEEAPSSEEVSEEERRWAYEVELLLAERVRAGRGDGAVALPPALTVTDLVALAGDPDGLAGRIRRPLPAPPEPYARRGTAFHRWLEQRFGAELGGPGTGELLDVDELPGAADAGAAPDDLLAELRRRFEAGPFADRVPLAVEVPFSTVLAGVVVRGRMDAVFAEPDGGHLVVDWKTGRRPTGDAARAAAVQLAAYRLAWSQLAGVPLARVGAAFHYVVDGGTVRPVDLLDAAALAALITDLPAADGDGAGTS